MDEVKEKARKGQVKVENAAAYIVATYQKKGVIPKLILNEKIPESDLLDVHWRNVKLA